MIELSRELLMGIPKNGPTDPIEYYRKPLIGRVFRERINRGLRAAEGLIETWNQTISLSASSSPSEAGCSCPRCLGRGRRSCKLIHLAKDGGPLLLVVVGEALRARGHGRDVLTQLHLLCPV